jgi:hypothetical protein
MMSDLFNIIDTIDNKDIIEISNYLWLPTVDRFCIKIY